MVPINRQVAIQLAEPPEGIDRSLWLYELCRFLTMKVNNLIVAFFAEDPPCSATTCPEMRASEWQYLCAVHDPPKSCCAIDYCCHTLDWAMNTLTSTKYFPSRLTLGNENAGGPQASMRHLTNVFRRLYRIFAHAWFQHRDVFWQVEGHDGLYVFFKTVCDMYSLIPHDNYTVPPEAEGPDAIQPEEEPVDTKRLTILRKKDDNPFGSGAESLDPALGTGATTRRHKHSPSTGSRVTTITEDMEDSPEIPSPLREALEESPERPVSVLEASQPPVETDEETSDEPSAQKEELTAETADEAKEEVLEEVGQPGPSEATEEAQPESEPKPEQPVDDKTEESAEHKTSETEEAPRSEDTETKTEPEQEASTTLEAKPEPEKEES